MEAKLRALKLKKASLIDQMNMLSHVSDTFYLQLGKTEADIQQLQRKIFQETKNPLDEN